MTKYRIVEQYLDGVPTGRCWTVQYKGWFFWHTVQEDVISTSFTKTLFFNSLENAKQWCKQQLAEQAAKELARKLPAAKWVTIYHTIE
jgi:hypothetical protein